MQCTIYTGKSLCLCNSTQLRILLSLWPYALSVLFLVYTTPYYLPNSTIVVVMKLNMTTNYLNYLIFDVINIIIHAYYTSTCFDFLKVSSKFSCNQLGQNGCHNCAKSIIHTIRIIRKTINLTNLWLMSLSVGLRNHS